MLPRFLTKNYPLDKHLFLIPRFALSLIGYYPESERTTKVQLWSFFNIVILGYGCYAEFYYGIHYLSIDIPSALDALCPVASSIMSFLKIFFIWWYREEYKFLIEKVRYLTAQQNSSGKVQMKKRYFTLATRLNALVFFFGFCTSTSYTLRHIVTNTFLYLKGQPIIYETPFKMMFPEALLSMPIYPITYILVHWHGYITVLAFVGADGFFLGFCFYFSTLLKAIQQDLQSILTDNGTKNNCRYDSEEKVCAALEDIIERHNEVAELTDKFSLIMVEITLCHFITSSIIIATSVVDLLLFSGYGIIVYVVYTCAVLTEIFLYCLGGNTVMDSSEDLATKAYSSEWYTHSVKIQKIVLLIMVRSQRAIIIKVPFFAPSLPALTAILRFTGSVIALAKSVI
ncbi:odorant receptor 24a [Lucilia cuprina]|uniref:odorant receptor 24a n=1 Tax=Lucilia cuprina TaxID=7375 RepID=UPI001F067BAE|nr:odorant receptor 24a [Lucilia cuprina]